MKLHIYIATYETDFTCGGIIQYTKEIAFNSVNARIDQPLLVNISIKANAVCPTGIQPFCLQKNQEQSAS